MTLNEYQELAARTSTYSEDPLGIAARFMGLSGEAGEATDKAKKEIRDHIDSAFLNVERDKALALELGDVLWYVSQCAESIGYTLQEIAQMNLDKLEDRYKRNQIHGSGDYR